ncbi:Monooxygenase MoxC [Macrococcoides canis]|uniref:Monooxygenase MoxC n=1 Tax=Macrococcoides canis TaxID=1855823 RepID=A0A1W7ACN2_9STAP|nr:NtaA/DmoA family FMN-dependent monooxygenase [Macrococcus canis]ARQ07378.1 Putative monooxygenase MoxC [Macrococcus canis]
MKDYLNNKNKKIKLAMMLVTGYGGENYSWRLEDSNPKAYTDINEYIKLAKLAEKGKIHTLFIADTPGMVGSGVNGDLARKSPMFVMEPMTILSAVAAHTNRIGLVATYSTTYNLPYNLARQLKSLDHISNGRVGWNAVTTGTPEVAYNFGNDPLPDTTTRYSMADEMVEAVQSLWNSFGEDAYIADKESGDFIDMSKIKPAHFQGEYYQTKGPLPIPPSIQGQPPIFQAGPSYEGIELAGKFASGVYANPFTIEEARSYRDALKQSAMRHRRNPDDIKMFSGFMVTVADTYEEALKRRYQIMDFMSDAEFGRQVYYLSAMIGINLSGMNLDEPLPLTLQDQAYPNPNDPRSGRAVELIKKGLSPREVLANGVINYHPVVVGTAKDVADFMETWFEAGATDGFSIVPESQSGVKNFVEKVVPELQKRGIFHDDYEGMTLRSHLEN